MDFRFRLTHDVAGEIEITEPDGWKNARIVLERDPEFYSLVERYEGSAGDAFIFYGSNNVVNGGVEYIKDIERTHGFDENIQINIDFSGDDEALEEAFVGLLDIAGKTEMVDNKVKVPLVRDSFWNRFINRLDTPVNLSSTTDLDGNMVSPVASVDVSLPCQKINQYFVGFLPLAGYSFIGGIAGNYYLQLDFDDTHLLLTDAQKAECIDEIDDHISGYPIIDNPEQPNPSFDLEFPGDVTVNNLTIIARHATSDTTTHLDADIKGYLYDGVTEHLLTRTDYLGSNGTTRRSRFVYTGGVLSDVRTLAVYLKNDSGSTSGDLQVLFDDQVEIGVGPTYVTKFDFFVATTFRDTAGEGYLLHDAFHGVIARLGLGQDAFYSEFLGSTLTQERTYDNDGCGWARVLMKGLQIRQYTLSDKPFFVSFKQLWEGANPLLNLCLGYDTIDGEQVIRIEDKGHVFEPDVSISFSNIREMESGYDGDHIFKKIKTGFQKWQSQNISGIDDPQTKHEYATRIQNSGKDIPLESTFIAASLAIESARRTTRKKSSDHQHDNDIFVIAINDTDVTPCTPELDENFDTITNLLNSDTRYNITETPLRILLRWANFIGGCLQAYTSSSYKFVSGEGNFDMVSDYSCASGEQCRVIVCDSLAENDDIPLGAPSNYNNVFGFLFYPMLYKMRLPMTWDEFQTIRSNREKPIGISQTDENHYRFYIKELSYNVTSGQADLLAWPKGKVGSSTFDPADLFPDIEVIDPPYIPVTGQGPIERSEQDSDDDSTGVITNPPGEDEETFFRILEDGDIRKTEDGNYRILEDGAILASNRYFNEGSASLYFYQDSEIPPANEITFFEEDEF